MMVNAQCIVRSTQCAGVEAQRHWNLANSFTHHSAPLPRRPAAPPTCP